MDTVIEGIVAFSAIFVVFGILAAVGGAIEYILNLRELRRRNSRRRELLPDPNPRSIVRRRGWNVPL
jgi:hypothetical protein